LIPKQGTVALVRLDVVDDLGGRQHAGLLAHAAQRVRAQVVGPRALPGVAVASLRR
jgi:hypothetical protein